VGGGKARLRPWAAEAALAAFAHGAGETVVIAPPGEPATEPEEGGPPGVAAGHTLVLPLTARGATLGALLLAGRVGGQRPLPEDVALASELAGRAGVALDNALLVREIREADRRKNEFLAMLAHELRNPLAPVRTAVKVLETAGIEHPTLGWARGVISRQVEHMVRLVDDLLDVARITRGKIRLRAEHVDAGEVVAAALETARPLCEAHRHEVEAHVEPGLVIEADSVRLAQVLGNLLNNAAKYTPDGGHISVSAVREGREVVFRVRDTGAGITPEMLPKVFDLFAQGDHSIDRAQGGLGIGLTLVRLLVELQGGRAEAHSEGLGLGSEFTVRMPALAGAAETRPIEDGPTAEGPPRRVLVVDDNVDAADSLSLVLQLTGHATRTAHDGPAALELAKAFSPDVVLLDIGLPGLYGYEVARRLRDDPMTAGAMVIAVSGYGLDSDRERSREAGFDHHLTKPVDYEELRGLLAGSRSGKAG
jgi:signal transduction histidine kinase/ActR/RegA family two-component response regulator